MLAVVVLVNLWFVVCLLFAVDVLRLLFGFVVVVCLLAVGVVYYGLVLVFLLIILFTCCFYACYDCDLRLCLLFVVWLCWVCYYGLI